MIGFARNDFGFYWNDGRNTLLLRTTIILLFVTVLDLCQCFSNNPHQLISKSFYSSTTHSLYNNVGRIRCNTNTHNNKGRRQSSLKGLINHNVNDALPLPTASNVVPLKVMIFVDGTWLYYSIYDREYERDVIAQKLGRNWKDESTPDWSSLPRVACQALLKDPKSSWSAIMPVGSNTTTNSQQPSATPAPQTIRPIEVSRVMVYSSMHRDTKQDSFRYKMFSEMSKAGFDVNMMETVGRGEKCVDIQLAVDMLYYATVPDAYDVALLLTGDRDFLPAVIRCRQKGRRIGLVSTRSGSLAFEDTPNLKDYDTIFLEDYVNEWIRKKIPKEMNSSSSSSSSSSSTSSGRKRSPQNSSSEVTTGKKESSKISPYTLNIVIKNFIEKSGKSKVSSRDVGRHLKELTVDGKTFVNEIKQVYGGLYQFLYLSEIYLVEADSRRHIKAFWVSLYGGGDSSEAKHEDEDDLDAEVGLSEDEKQFMKSYKQRPEKDKNEEYEFTFNDPDPGFDIVSHLSNATGTILAPINSDVIESESSPVDYNTLTVVELKDICREKGLKIAAKKKIEIIERIEEHNASEKKQKQQVKITIGDLKPERYLEMLVLEYLHATGGQASSRDVGRYLAANKASYKRRLTEKLTVQPISALIELKEIYGSLNIFVKAFSYLYSKKISSKGREFYICIDEDSAQKPPSVEGTMARR
jgi:uncharacterized LabA/DUF88 family protein